MCQHTAAGSALHKEAINACTKFKKLFSKYAMCHEIISRANEITAQDLTNLGMFTFFSFLFGVKITNTTPCLGAYYNMKYKNSKRNNQFLNFEIAILLHVTLSSNF